MKIKICIGIIICSSLIGQITKGQIITSPSGTMRIEGGCTSACCFGRVTIFFFEDGNCVRRSIDETPDRLVYFGTWKLEGSEIKVHYHTAFYGKPIGETVIDNNRCGGERFSLYTAVKEDIDIHDSYVWNDDTKRSFILITSEYGSSGRNSHKFRADFSQFNFLSTRIRTDKQYIYSEQYLSHFSKVELRLLRNEIFAKYGLRFRDSVLYNYFNTGIYEGVRIGHSEQGYYEGIYDDVTVFLNQYDLENINLIIKFENM